MLSESGWVVPRIDKLAAAVFIFSFLPGLALASLEPAPHPLFGDDAVHEFRLTFHQPDWWEELRVNFEGQGDRLYLAAEFDWQAIHFDSIGVRFKGFSSYYVNNTEKKSFKLDIDRFVQGQEIHGLDKLNLQCGFKDPSFVREAVCYELCKEAGLPTVRTSFVALYINDVYWGLYTLAEQIDQQFIASRFGQNETGNLWKGDPHGTLEDLGSDQTAYYSQYGLKTNEVENDWSALLELVDKLNNTPIESLLDTIHPLIDVNSALALLAVDNLTVNLDSYAGRCANYYLYQRDTDGRFVFTQWDLNMAWGGYDAGMSVDTMKHLDPYWTSAQSGEHRPLAERLWQVSAYSEIYIGHMQKLMAGAAHPDTLLDRMEELRDLVRPYVHLEEPPRQIYTAEQFEEAMSTDIGGGGVGIYIPGLEPFIRDRDAWLREQLGTWDRIDGLVLNEVVARNSTTLADEYGEYEDWIEITNTGAVPIDLTGWALSDNLGDPTASFSFPSMAIAGGDYVLIWADAQPEQGELHAPFKLSADGEDLYLMDGAIVVDQMTCPVLGDDQAFGRWPDGTGAWRLLSDATPAAQNQNNVTPEQVALFINEILAINDSGLQDETGAYEDWLEIYNPGPDDVETGGLYLTDDLAFTTQWMLPDTTLPAKSFLIVFCDNDPEDGRWHATFRLSGDGEEIGIFGRLTAGNEEIDSRVFGPQIADVSEGRRPDSGPNWESLTPTPGTSNNAAGLSVVAVYPARPNPFISSVHIAFDVPLGGGLVRAAVYDVGGREVYRIVDGHFPAGFKEVQWDGRTLSGDRLASGVYFTRIQIGVSEFVQRLTLLRD